MAKANTGRMAWLARLLRQANERLADARRLGDENRIIGAQMDAEILREQIEHAQRSARATLPAGRTRTRSRIDRERQQADEARAAGYDRAA